MSVLTLNLFHCTSPEGAVPAPDAVQTADLRLSWYRHHHHSADLAVSADMAVRPSPDLAAPAADLSVKAAPDLEMAPPPPDMEMAPAHDMAVAHDMAIAPDLVMVMGGGPLVAGAEPESGAVGTVLTVTGTGFKVGDTVELSGANLAATALATVTLTATSIVAVVPALKVAVPDSLLVRVRSGGVAVPANGLPFTLTQGALHYMATNGSDANAGTLASPWATLAASASKMNPGDITYLRGGVYNQINKIAASGTPGLPLTFTAYPGESVTVTSGGWTLELNSNDVTIDNMHLTTSGNAATVNIGATANRSNVTNCEIYNSGQTGLFAIGKYSLIYRNHIHNNGSHAGLDHGIYVVGNFNTIRSNVINDNFSYGIQFHNGSTFDGGSNTAEYNYIYNNGYGNPNDVGSAYNAGVIITQGSPGNTIRYNRICGNLHWAVYITDSITGTVLLGNATCYNGSGGYALTASGSTNLHGSISFNDGPVEIDGNGSTTSDKNDWYLSSGLTPRFTDRGTNETFAAWKTSTGQDGSSVTTNPKFNNVPTTGWNAAAAVNWDYCTTVIPQLCNPLP